MLDIGGGRHPAIPPAQRAERITYIGLDIDAREFAAAGAGSYDRTIVADAATAVQDLRGAVDLAISWQVFEQVQQLERVLDNTYDYLKPVVSS